MAQDARNSVTRQLILGTAGSYPLRVRKNRDGVWGARSEVKPPRRWKIPTDGRIRAPFSK